MTPYEQQSLTIASEALETAQLGVIAAYLSIGVASFALVASVVAGWIIYHQLKSQRWMSLLSFEQDMDGRRRSFTALALQLDADNPPSNLRAIFEAEREGYLNAVDRLASSILNGQFPEKEMKQDYRDYIANVVKEFPDQFRVGTRYRKVVKLYEHWQD
jgi:hypothetical protein